MQRRTVTLGLALLLLLAGALPALAAADTAAALDYLKSQQNADGGFGSGFSPDSSVGSTADAVLAIVAAGGDPSGFAQNGKTPLTYLAANAADVAIAGDLAKLIMAVVAMDENPRTFGGVDSVARLEGMAGASGKIGTTNDIFVSHLLAVLALKSAQRPVPAAAVAYVESAQQENGAWAWDGTATTGADTNTTAFAVQALIAAGRPATSGAVISALAYLGSLQNDDGGWPYESPSQYGTATDANSTAVVTQALIAAGQDPAGAEWTTASGGTPLAALEALQNESGAFAWQAAVPDDNLLATLQALPAVAGKAFPLATMEVGDPAVAAPVAMPETGGALPGLAVQLVAAGLALAGAGYAGRRRR